MPTPRACAEEVRHALAAAADPAIAPGQQAYMKSAMPFRGVRMPAVRKATRRTLGGIDDPGLLVAVARELWDPAEFREDRYAAIATLGLRPTRTRIEILPTCRHLIITGAWWDLVDASSSRVAELLINHRETVTPTLLEWAVDDHLWLRRAAVISQLGAKERTDTELLTRVIRTNVTDPDFFIRKAIGWALRDFARTDPDWVRGFVDDHELSPLSRREAVKHL